MRLSFSTPAIALWIRERPTRSGGSSCRSKRSRLRGLMMSAATSVPKTVEGSHSPSGISSSPKELFKMPEKVIQSSPRLPEDAIFSATVEAGDPFVHEIPKGQFVRIVDLEGNQAVDTLVSNAHNYADRYSAQDTIREQNNIYLTTGTKLISTERNVLLTIVADTCGRHDTLGGACATESNMVRYAIEKRSMHACRQSFLKALRLRGPQWEKRDIANNINFFMNVP